MRRIVLPACLIALGASLIGTAPPAQANRQCGYDRYGYHAPNFRGCEDYSSARWEGRWRQSYRDGDVPVDSSYDLPLYGARAGHRCYYDHAWTNVVLVCY